MRVGPAAELHATTATEGARSLIAAASSSVRLGRFSNSRKLLPAEKLARLNFDTMTVFDPSCRTSDSSWSPNPRTSDVMPTIDVTPITTPSIVRNDRSLLVLSVPSAIVTISARRPVRMAMDGGKMSGYRLSAID